MNEGREQKESDTSAMMDLFRSEVKRHSLTIHDGLQSLAADPTTLDSFQTMIPAIQAIKGGGADHRSGKGRGHCPGHEKFFCGC